MLGCISGKLGFDYQSNPHDRVNRLSRTFAFVLELFKELRDKDLDILTFIIGRQHYDGLHFFLQLSRQSFRLCLSGIVGFHPVNALNRALDPKISGMSEGRSRAGSFSTSISISLMEMRRLSISRICQDLPVQIL